MQSPLRPDILNASLCLVGMTRASVLYLYRNGGIACQHSCRDLSKVFYVDLKEK